MLDYSYLREVQKKEMESSAVVSLPDDFYRSVSELLSKKGQEAQHSKSLLAIKEYENIKRIVAAIQTKREEKIVLMALRGENEGGDLTNEEKELLKELSSIIKKSRDVVKNVWDRETPVPDDSRRIRIIKDVAEYRGLDNSVYGPFTEGEEQLLPQPEAQWLLKAGLAEPV